MLSKIFNITLAFLVFISSTGVILNKHYCQSELKGASLFFLPESCHSKLQKAVCPSHTKPITCDHESDSGCCDNNSDYLKVDHDKQLQVLNLEEQLPAPLSLVIVFVNHTINDQQLTINAYKAYKPPIVRNNIPSLLQTFLF